RGQDGGGDARRSAGASGAEEVPQQVPALLPAHAGDELDAVVQPRFAHQVVEGAGGPGLGIHRADDDPSDAGEHDRAGAHRARLEGDHERAAGEVPAARGGGRTAQREDLGVGGGVLVGLAAVPGGGEHGAVGGDDDRADRDVGRFAGGGGPGL